jgi:hypothetical protein
MLASTSLSKSWLARKTHIDAGMVSTIAKELGLSASQFAEMAGCAWGRDHYLLLQGATQSSEQELSGFTGTAAQLAASLRANGIDPPTEEELFTLGREFLDGSEAPEVATQNFIECVLGRLFFEPSDDAILNCAAHLASVAFAEESSQGA